MFNDDGDPNKARCRGILGYQLLRCCFKGVGGGLYGSRVGRGCQGQAVGKKYIRDFLFVYLSSLYA
jgi:hypothetical protein